MLKLRFYVTFLSYLCNSLILALLLNALLIVVTNARH
jgi:hypothetical protein